MSNTEVTRPTEAGGEKAGAALTSTARALTAPLVILFVGITVLYPLWLHRGVPWSRHSDIIAQHLSIHALGKDTVGTEGSLPFWNPSMSAGLPAFANPESMYLYPFNLLSFVVPLDVSLRLIIILNVLVAGLSMYLFSRGYCQRAAAVF